MKYLALLRGINVGGKSTVKMSELKKAFEKAGFDSVATFINSGNVVFESNIKESKKVKAKVDKLLHTTFFTINTSVVSRKELEKILQHIPKNWKNDDLRRYIAFVIPPSQPKDVIGQAQLKEGIDAIDVGPSVVYMSTKMEGLTKSSFPKLATKPIYKDMTIRNYSTMQKLIHLMETK